MAEPDPITPDTKDWTWVLQRPCPECGFDPAAEALTSLPDRLHDSAMVWSGVLARSDAAVRPGPSTWSALEYACHVRDVHRVFAKRVHQLLTEDEPRFANWDQDATAVEDGYAAQDPAVVGPELLAAAAAVADQYAGVPPYSWHRRGTRSNGSEFTVESLGRYHLHDVVHHLHDITRHAGATGADR
jgi:hypothetical protein